MLHVTSCKYTEEYKLALTFDNGTGGVVDLKDFSESGTVFAPLKNKEIFCNVHLEDYGVITWLDGTLDVAPEYLFFLINQFKPELRNLFKEWGYI